MKTFKLCKDNTGIYGGDVFEKAIDKEILIERNDAMIGNSGYNTQDNFSYGNINSKSNIKGLFED